MKIYKISNCKYQIVVTFWYIFKIIFAVIWDVRLHISPKYNQKHWVYFKIIELLNCTCVYFSTLTRKLKSQRFLRDGIKIRPHQHKIVTTGFNKIEIMKFGLITVFLNIALSSRYGKNMPTYHVWLTLKHSFGLQNMS